MTSFSLLSKSSRTQKNATISPTHILVDEAQDLDPVQIKLIKRLSGKKPNVTFFLDYNQAIFSFKGAIPDAINRIGDIYPNTRKFYLLKNHRSTGKILESANRLIRLNGSENSSVPTREEGLNPLWVRVPDEISEAQLAREIAVDLIHQGFQPRDILILYRTNHYRAEVESELIENEIPYSILKNTSIFLKEGPFLPLCLQAWRPSDAWEQTLLTHYLGRRSSSEICSLAGELKLSPFETAIEQSITNAETEKGMNLLLQDLREIQLLQRKQTSGGGRSRVGDRREKRLHRRHQGDERALQAHGPIPEPGRNYSANRKAAGPEHGLEAETTASLDNP